MHLLIRQPKIEIQRKPFSKIVNSSVGGFIIGKTPCQTTVTLDRPFYYAGETISVKIDCNNSECKKAVERFKLEIKQSIRHVVKDVCATRRFHKTLGFNLPERFTETSGIFKVKIPEKDPFSNTRQYPNFDPIDDIQKRLINELSPSCNLR